MTGEGGLLSAWKERGLFILTAVAFAGYVIWLFLAAPTDGLDAETLGGAGREEKDQRYVRAAGRPALPADAAEVFARPGKDAYFDEALRRVWVEPQKEAFRPVMRLAPPPPVVPAPPMLLPVPGPALHATAGLLRWPAMPVSIVEEEEEAAEGERGNTLTRSQRVGAADEKRQDVKPRVERPRGETSRDPRTRGRRGREEGAREKRRGGRRRPEREGDR